MRAKVYKKAKRQKYALIFKRFTSFLETILYCQIHPVGMACLIVEIRTPSSQVFGTHLQVGSYIPEQVRNQILAVTILFGRSDRIIVVTVQAGLL